MTGTTLQYQIFLYFLILISLTSCHMTKHQASSKKHAVSQDITLTGAACGDTYHIEWQVSNDLLKTIRTAALYRSSTNLDYNELDLVKFPITKREIAREAAGRGSLDDTQLAFNTEYFYIFETIDDKDNHSYSTVISLRTPSKKLGELHEPVIEVDKIYYLLTITEGNSMVMRYPVALGKNPVTRKMPIPDRRKEN